MISFTQNSDAMQAEVSVQQEAQEWAVIERATKEVVDIFNSEEEALEGKWHLVEYDRIMEQYVPKKYAVMDPHGNVL